MEQRLPASMLYDNYKQINLLAIQYMENHITEYLEIFNTVDSMLARIYDHVTPKEKIVHVFNTK